MNARWSTDWLFDFRRQEQVSLVLQELEILPQPADLDVYAFSVWASVTDGFQKISDHSFGNGGDVRDQLLGTIGYELVQQVPIIPDRFGLVVDIVQMIEKRLDIEHRSPPLLGFSLPIRGVGIN